MSGRSPRWFTGIKYPYEDNFADNTWAQIIAACRRKAVPATWKVADQKAMAINGTDYLIDIIGLNHDDYADGSGKAPITFQMHDCYDETYAMNSGSTNVGSWKDSIMRTVWMPDILALMPSEVKSAVRGVTKKTSAGNATTGIVTTTDDLFLPSEVEVFGSATYAVAGEGSQYAYYASGGSTIKRKAGTAYGWNLRSPRKGNTTQFVCVLSTGKVNYRSASQAYGIPFCWCF